MEDKNKQIPKQEAPKTNEGAVAVKSSAWKRLLAKKWVFPATYIAAAAIILTLVWVYQYSGNPLSGKNAGVVSEKTGSQTAADGEKSGAVAVTAQEETMQWPVKDRSEMDEALPYYDSKASNDVKQAAMIEYGDTYTPHMGVDFTRPDGQTFDVLAAMSGTVTRVEKLPVVGNQIEITHANGLKTVYQSLGEISVAKDVQVKKGDVIAKAGRNELEKELGYHVHFEVLKNDAAVNPEQVIGGN